MTGHVYPGGYIGDEDAEGRRSEAEKIKGADGVSEDPSPGVYRKHIRSLLTRDRRSRSNGSGHSCSV